jgi:TonB-linked SusC/RagA family outer membrane protein
MVNPLQAQWARSLYRPLFTITFFFFLFTQHTQAGTLQKSEQVTISGKNLSLRQVFKNIQQQTGYSLLFANGLVSLNLEEKVTVDFQNTPLRDALNTLLKPRNLVWTLMDESIVVKKPDVPPTATAGGDTTITGIPISGIITDMEANPLIGVNVIINGTAIGTTTDTTGRFHLPNVPKNGVLVISSVGYESRQIKVTRSSMSVKLNAAISSLDETVVIAYGKTSKRLSTGNIGSVKAKDIERQPVTNPLLSLQGRVPGLQIIQNSGIPGGSISVRIQGQNSIMSGNDPLYVIDGVPINSQLPVTGNDYILGSANNNGSGSGYGNPLSYINAFDIESIDVLKDADATAIYGSRAANGAILITTKKGKAGKTKVDVNLQQGWGKVAHRVPMMNTRQYLDMRYEAFKNDGIDWKDPAVSANDLKLWDTTSYTNWQKTLIGNTAQFSNANIAASGGTPTIQYRIGATYNKQTTVFPYQNFSDQKAAFSSSLTINSPDQRFHFQWSNNYLLDENQLPALDLTLSSILLQPNAPALYNSDGSLNWEPDANGNSTFINPLSNAARRYENNTDNLISNIVASYKLLPSLQFETNMGYTSTKTDDYSSLPITAIRPEWRNSIQQRGASFGNRSLKSWIIEPQLKYSRVISRLQLQALVGATILNKNETGGTLTTSGQSSDEVLKNPMAAATWSYQGAFINKYKYVAGFSRITFNWDSRLILNLTGRRDGSSRFGPANRYFNFGAVGGAWIFSNESIVQNNLPWLSFGKLRASYGTTGNDQIGDYGYISTYGPMYGVEVPYQQIAAIYPTKLPNPNLKWEKTNKLQIGMDLGFFKDRIVANATYVHNQSSNQLLSSILPTFTGFNELLQNFPAVVTNTAIELGIVAQIVKGNTFNWSMSGNLTIPKNRLTAFPTLASSSYANLYVVGKSINITKTYHLLGVDPASGQYTFADTHGNPTSMPAYPDDYNVIIDLSPKLYGGLQNTLSYKGINLDILLQYTKQVGASLIFGNNSIITPGSFNRSGGNQPVTVLNRWQQLGDQQPVQKFSSQLADPHSTYAQGSDANYTDASYLRVKNVSLSWSVPKGVTKKVVNDLQLYLQCQNLFTITNYKGLDPEVLGTNSLPPLRVVTFGIKAGF